MTNPNKRTIAALEKMMQEMQFLVDHPRMQQRNWVAKGREWLPILRHAKEDLEHPDGVVDSTNSQDISPDGDNHLLVKVNNAYGEAYLNVALEDIARVVVYRGGEKGYSTVRGGHSAFELKNGERHLTTADEAQRIVDARRKLDDTFQAG